MHILTKYIEDRRPASSKAILTEQGRERKR